MKRILLTPQAANRLLGDLRAQCNAQDGRGVELAEKIGNLQNAIALSPGDASAQYLAACAFTGDPGGDGSDDCGLILPAADSVGQSEYLVLYDHLTNVLESAKEGKFDPVSACLDSLAELIDQAKAIHRDINERFPVQAPP